MEELMNVLWQEKQFFHASQPFCVQALKKSFLLSTNTAVIPFACCLALVGQSSCVAHSTHSTIYNYMNHI
jgi:hypothetical protein